MKYWDTSALLRAWKEGWIPREGMTRPHSVAEWVSIQTGRGLVYQLPDGSLVKQNLSPTDAANEARRLFANFHFVSLSGDQTLAAAAAPAKIPAVQGPVVHDFMHIAAAEQHRAESLVTLNVHEWSKMTKLRIEAPSQ